MFRVAEYLVEARRPNSAPSLRLLETRGGGSPLWSPLYLLRAMVLVLLGRITGRLAGVHVNGAERLSVIRKGALLAACKLLRVPTVFHLHAAELPSSYARLPPASKSLVRKIFSLPDCCIVLGQSAANFLVNDLGVPAGKVRIVFNGVPDIQGVSRVRKGEGEGEGRLKVLFVGNLSERKGVSDLLQALTEPVLDDVPLDVVLVGGGDVARYRALAGSLGVGDRVTFLGWADKARVDQCLADADIFILPSHHEGLPLAILEALAVGVPVVCTPVGEIPHVLQHRQHALLVQPGNRQEIAAALSELAASRSLRASLATSGRRLYERQFAIGHFARHVAQIHRETFSRARAQADARVGQHGR